METKTKHTAGPWEAICVDHAWRVVAGPFAICDVRHQSGQTQANARLIAAAPALAEALRNAVDRMEAVAEGIVVEKRHKGISQATHVRHMARHLAQHAKIARKALRDAG